MAKSICEYCGSYIDNTSENCSVCNAINPNYERFVPDTPRTIQELKSWYTARNLPPEHITRFFIGRDIGEPKAFGIYEKNGKFIVYKNKADGSRAIRYKGTDEAYAVNELYLKLKEEILRQKNHNLNRKTASFNNETRTSYSKRKYSKPRSILRIFITSIAPSLLVLLSLFIFLIANGTFKLYNSYYYLDSNNQIYYCQNEDKNDDIWWLYNKDTKEWSQFDILKEKTYPDGIIKNSAGNVTEIAKKLNLDQRDIDITYSKTFIDAGNHQTPKTAYYYHDNRLYYYLDDIYSSYGSTNNSGWYIYENNKWEFYCSESDKEKLGNDLWYSDIDYNVGTDINNIYTYNDELSKDWNKNITNFEDTTWYESYKNNENAYHEYQSKQDDNNNNWDNDNDYDWNNDYDWDNDIGDWDSDW